MGNATSFELFLKWIFSASILIQFPYFQQYAFVYFSIFCLVDDVKYMYNRTERGALVSEARRYHG